MPSFAMLNLHKSDCWTRPETITNCTELLITFHLQSISICRQNKSTNLEIRQCHTDPPTLVDGLDTASGNLSFHLFGIRNRNKAHCVHQILHTHLDLHKAPTVKPSRSLMFPRQYLGTSRLDGPSDNLSLFMLCLSADSRSKCQPAFSGHTHSESTKSVLLKARLNMSITNRHNKLRISLLPTSLSQLRADRVVVGSLAAAH